MAQEFSIARIVDTMRGALVRQQPRRSLAYRDPRPLAPTIRNPVAVVSVYERDIRETGAFVMEGDVTAWNWQPGTQTAKLDIQDYEMNAAMQGSGQTNCNLNVPVAVANYIPPRSRVRITVEIL